MSEQTGQPLDPQHEPGGGDESGDGAAMPQASSAGVQDSRLPARTRDRNSRRSVWTVPSSRRDGTSM